MGDFSTICELRGKAANGRGCTNRNRYPNGVRHCAKRNARGSCITSDVDAINFDNATAAMQALREARNRAVVTSPEYLPLATGVTLTMEGAPDAALTRIYGVIAGAAPLLDRTVFDVTRMSGGRPTINVNNGVSFPAASISPSTTGSNLSGVMPGVGASLNAWGWEYECVADASKVQIRHAGNTASGLRVLVDGRYVSRSALMYVVNNSQNYITLVFPDKRRRSLQIQGAGGASDLRSIAVGPGDALYKPDPLDNPFLVLSTGDSYSEGTGASIPGLFAWPKQLGRRMGWTDNRQVAVGQTGYLSNSGGTRKDIMQQVADWQSLHSDISLTDVKAVNLGAGFNDHSPSNIPNPNVLLPAKALLTYQVVRAACPNAVLLVYGSQAGARGPDAQTRAIDAIIRSAFLSWSDPNSIFIPVTSATPPWIVGTGYVGNTNGTGNSDTLISNDGIHPSDAGHLEISRRAELAIDTQLAQAA